MEMICPVCMRHMKEYVTKFRCRSCDFVYEKYFQKDLISIDKVLSMGIIYKCKPLKRKDLED